MSAFLEYHYKSITQKVKSDIKDTNELLCKLDSLPFLPEDIISFTIDVVGLYSNILYEDGLVAMRKALNAPEDKTVSTDTLIEHNTSSYKQLRGATIRTKMAPPNTITIISDLEEKFLKDCDKNPLTWSRYIQDIFML